MMEDDFDFQANSDWDPNYLSRIFEQDFDDVSHLWEANSVSDKDMLEVASNVEREIYCPITEDISMDDCDLQCAVEKIESQ